MDRFVVMQLFVRIVERRSFSAAARDLGMSRSSASEAIQRLEARLGVRLLQRTTRHVAPTAEGEGYYRRCALILADVEEAETNAARAEPSGVLHIDVHGTMARHFLLPHLPAFLQRYPRLSLHIGEGDRLVDLVREGVDCVIRAGIPVDSDMIARRLATLDEAVVASPAYLERYGVPQTPDDLDGHRMIGFVSSATGEVMPLGLVENSVLRPVTLESTVTVTSSDTGAALARLGLGITQAPRYRFADDFAAGRLVEILADYAPPPTPVSVLYSQRRQLSPRVRVFVDWAVAVFADRRGRPTAAAGSPLNRPGLPR